MVTQFQCPFCHALRAIGAGGFPFEWSQVVTHLDCCAGRDRDGRDSRAIAVEIVREKRAQQERPRLHLV